MAGSRRSDTSRASSRAKSGKGAGRKRNSGKKKQKTMFDIVASSDFRATAAFLIGLLTLSFGLFSGGEDSAWYGVHSFWLTVFGLIGILGPAASVYLSCCYFLKKDMKKLAANTRRFFLGCLIAQAVGHVLLIAEEGLSFGQSLSDVFAYGMNHSGGEVYFSGETGALTGGGLYAICGSKGLSVFILFVLLAALIMVSFRISMRTVVERASVPAGKIKNITDAGARNLGSYVRDNGAQVKSRVDEKIQQNVERRRLVREERENTVSQRTDMRGRDDSRRYRNTNGYGGGTETAGRSPSVSRVPIIDSFSESDAQVPVTAVPASSFPREATGEDILNMLKNLGCDIPVELTGENTPPENEKAEDIPAVPVENKAPVRPAASVNEEVGKARQYNGKETGSGLPPIIPMSAEEVVAADGEVTAVPAAEKPVPAEPLTDIEKSMMSEELSQSMAEVQTKEYVFPPIEILRLPEKRDKYYDEQELYRNGDKLIEALASFNVSASISAIVPGPTVTRYEITPAPGVKISKFTGLADDLALCLAAPAGIRIEAPIPNKSAIGIEIPNRDKLTITFREVIDTPEFRNAKGKLTVGLGKNISGEPVFCNIAKMPHLLVAGTTGSGKSVLMNSMIASIIYRAKPEEVRMILIDPKQVEFGVYNGIPHLLVPVVSDARKASGALAWAVTEMLDRYKSFKDCKARDLEGYNIICEREEGMQKLPQIVIFIDELADLMIAAPTEVEDSIQRLAQMGRAAGMHLVVATQRPSVDVITGVIKANMSSRIGLTVKSQIDSRTILDAAGAEKLTGHGDMLYAPVDFAKPLRVQGCYLSDAEIIDIVRFLKDDNGEAQYSSDIEDSIIRSIPQGKRKAAEAFGEEAPSGGCGISDDDKFVEAMEYVLDNPDMVSISSLQRHLRIGFSRAGRLVDEMLEKGFIKDVEGSKTKKAAITRNEWLELLAMSSGGSGGNQSAAPRQGVVTDRNAGDDPFINPDSVSNVTDEEMGFSGNC